MIATLVSTEALIISRAPYVSETESIGGTVIPRRLLSAEPVLLDNGLMSIFFHRLSYIIRKSRVLYPCPLGNPILSLTLFLSSRSQNSPPSDQNSPMCLRGTCIYSAPLRVHRSLHHPILPLQCPTPSSDSVSLLRRRPQSRQRRKMRVLVAPHRRTSNPWPPSPAVSSWLLR